MSEVLNTLRTRFQAPNRTPHGPNSIHTEDQDALVDTASREPDVLVTPSGFVGPRGRDQSGQPVQHRQGMPPAVEGAMRVAPEIPKDILHKAGQAERWQITVSATGIQMDKQAGFPIRGMQLDNYSSCWLYVPAAQRYIPPFVYGVQFPVFGAPNKMQVLSEAPPGYTQPAAISGNIAEIATYERELDYSPGIPVQEQGGVPSGSASTLALAKSTTGTESNVASSATAVTLLAANAARLGAAFWNDSTQVCYLILSATTPSATVYTVQIPAQSYYEIPGPYIYTGIVQGIWTSANGNMRVTELT